MRPIPSYQPLDQPLGGTNGDWSHRILHFHIPLALMSTVVIFIWMTLPLFQAAGHQAPPEATQTTNHQGPHQSDDQASIHQSQQQPHGATTPTGHTGNQTENADRNQNRVLVARFTTATGYVALGLLGFTLLIGPANLLLRRRTPISSYLARDVGMWAAILSVVHVIAGFFVHGPPASVGQRILFYFFSSDGRPLTNAFGWGNWTGLVATVIVVGLLTISSDLALRKLKARAWKNLQRLNYALFMLVIAHTVFYGALSRVKSFTTILLGLIVSFVLVGQLMGVWLWQRKHARTASKSM
jgi:methionine sulfoxide reductase heme-binding subunit